MSIIQKSLSITQLPKAFSQYARLPMAIATLLLTAQAQAFLPTPESVMTTGVLSDDPKPKTDLNPTMTAASVITPKQQVRDQTSSSALTANATTTSPTAVTAEQLLNIWRKQAQADNLAQHTTWRRLLYFVDDKKGIFAKNTNKSLIDNPAFFLAANGQQDSAAELEATLMTLAQELTTPTSNNKRVAADDSVLCQFPARVKWLTDTLNIDNTTLKIDCPKLDAWMTMLAPEALSVTFAQEYLDNPISAFGHTLLRIDSPASAKDFNQIHHAYALNDTVNGDKSDNFGVFAVKALSGGYNNIIEIDPYPKKIADYLQVDERDTWTYQLALTPSEVQQIILHVWETKDLALPYYFTTDNCASEILRLVDTVRPNQHLLSQLPYVVVPADVVNLLKTEGLLASSRYTPADSSVRQAQLNLAKKQAAIDKKQLGYKTLDKDELNAIKSAKLNTASSMSADAKSLLPLAIAPSANNPLDRHPLQRAHIGIGQSGDNNYIDIGVRAGFQDTLDRTAGFDQFFDLEGIKATLRFYDNNDNSNSDSPKSVELQNFTLLRGRSYNPVNSAEKGKTWGANIEATRVNDGSQQGGTAHLVGSTTLEYGKSWAFGTPRTDASGLMSGEMPPQLCYALATGALQGGRGINKGYRIGAGVNAGCIYQLNNRLRAEAELQLPYWYHGSSDQVDVKGSYWQPITTIGLQYDIDKKQALRLNASYELQDRVDANDDFSLAYMRYF